MSEIILQPNGIAPQALPEVNVAIRPGVVGDVPFLDSLQKLHTKQVGWMPTATFEGKIKLGHVLIAEVYGERVGYCIGNDQYFKRDDVGIIYQMNVLPRKQRGFIGASLLKAQFERSAYGCKLYCCWCAQDIAANKFWEAMGFVPLAFRAGSEKKSRVHIFWQKRIRSGDVTTPWWFPSKTAGGSIREDRIVLPIPPGTHWSDAKPLIFPDALAAPKTLPDPKRATVKKPKVIETPAPVRRNGLMFDIPMQGEPLPEAKAVKEPKPKVEKVKRVCDPRLVSAARELRDRWMEQVNATPLLPSGKYEVSRMIDDQTRVEVIEPMKMLAA
jgi:hypothetical protein